MAEEKIKLNVTEKAVLARLAEEFDPVYGEHKCFYTSGLEKGLKLKRIQARRAVRSLVNKGLAELVKGLIDENNGLLAGSGYSATDDGYRYAMRTKLIQEN